MKCPNLVSDRFAEERFKKGAELALFDEKDRDFVRTVVIASHRKQKNFDIIKFKDMYHINDIRKIQGLQSEGCRGESQ